MNFRVPAVTAALLCAVVCPSIPAQRSVAAGTEPTLEGLLRTRADLTVLRSALHKSGLLERLAAADSVTLFAPTDEAFSRVGLDLQSIQGLQDASALTRVLTQHVVGLRVSALDAANAGTAQNIAGNGLDFAFEKGRLQVRLVGGSSAQVIDNDLQVRQGVVHVLDQVLTPAWTTDDQLRSAVQDLLERGVRIGAPQFNEGRVELCCEVYELTLIAARGLAGDLFSPELRRRIDRYLTNTPGKGRRQARALRDLLEASFAELQPGATPEEERAAATPRSGGWSRDMRPASTTVEPSSRSGEPLIDELRRARASHSARPARGHG